jgi:hypothetical protein
MTRAPFDAGKPLLLGQTPDDPLVSADGLQRQRLDPALTSALRIFTAIKRHELRTTAAKEPVRSWRGNQRDFRSPQRGVQIYPGDALDELLFARGQDPLPGEPGRIPPEAKVLVWQLPSIGAGAGHQSTPNKG